GDLDQAEAIALEGLAHRREVGSALLLSILTLTQGVVSLIRGDTEAAARTLSESIAFGALTGAPYCEANGLQFLAIAQVRLGRIQEAERTFEEAGVFL